MADYKKMYGILCCAVSKVIEASPEDAKQLLQEALYATEEMQVCSCEMIKDEDTGKAKRFSCLPVMDECKSRKLSENREALCAAKRQYIYAIVEQTYSAVALDRIYLAINQTLFKMKAEAEPTPQT